MLQTIQRFITVKDARSLFERGYLSQFAAREGSFPAPLPLDGLREVRDLAYGADPLQTMDLFYPTTPARPLPVVMFVHGGGWRVADKRDSTNTHRNVALALAREGFLVANVNHRLTGGYQGQVSDLAQAVRWLREKAHQHHGDPHQLFLSGHSSGGHLTALLALDERYLAQMGLTPRDINGVIGVSGVYDVAHFSQSGFNLKYMTRPAFGDDPQAWHEASPVNYVSADAPPFLLLNAAHDEGLEVESEAMRSQLTAAGVAADWHILPQTNHFTILSYVGAADHPLIAHMVAFLRAGVTA